MITIKLVHQWLLTIGLLPVIVGCQAPDSRNQAGGKSETSSTAEKKTKSVTQKTIVCYGNSLTYGYGLDNPPEQSYPGRLSEMLDSAGYAHYKVVNAGLSGETTSGGRTRLDWVLERNSHLEVFILELGANDGLRGIPPKKTEENLNAIIDSVAAFEPQAHILLCGMRVPPNMGPDYAESFRTIFRRVARQQEIHFVPFLLEGVAGVPSLNQEDGIHPTAKGHKIMARNIWPKLEPRLAAQDE